MRRKRLSQSVSPAVRITERRQTISLSASSSCFGYKAGQHNRSLSARVQLLGLFLLAMGHIQCVKGFLMAFPLAK